MEITATIKHAPPVKIGEVWVIFGDIHGDTRKRFADGTGVKTSAVTIFDGRIIVTRNSTYEIESWLSPKAEEDARRFYNEAIEAAGRKEITNV